MKRVLIGFFLLLFVFLTSGYSQLLAQSWSDAKTLVPTKHLTTSNPGAAQGKFIVEKEPAEGEEDNDSFLAKTYLDFGDIFFASDFFAPQQVASVPSGSPEAVIIPVNRYIIFQVFRV